MQTSSWRFHVIAIALLVFMGALAFSLASTDSITTDEAPHITSGYSYLAFQEYRLNPEHPPLMKDLAALPLLFQNLHFPTNSFSWTQNTNDQWELAHQFLFKSGNNPDSIIFWGRLGPIAIMLALGGLIYLWTRKLFGSWTGIFALFLYTFSPEMLANGHLVTTDVPAALAFLAATYFYVQFLKKQTTGNFVLASFVIALAQVTKFSLVLVWPLFVVITIFWIIFHDRPMQLFSLQLFKKFLRYALIFAGIVALTYIFVFPVYQFHVLHFSPERQIQDFNNILNEPRLQSIDHVLVWMAYKPVLRAYAQYFLGLTMVFLRVGGGNTTYFLGQESAVAWWYYFPVVFSLKVPLAFLVFVGLSIYIFCKTTWRKLRIMGRARETLKEKLHGLYNLLSEVVINHFDEVCMATFIVIYWVISMRGNLNIGLRHVLPTIPFMYILVAGQIHRWLRTSLVSPTSIQEALYAIASLVKRAGKTTFVFIILIFYASALVRVYPYPLAYFNELAGGPAGGYRYVADSNLDWGQDLKRLAQFVQQNNIQHIKLDYFGGSDTTYYLGDKFQQLHGSDGPQKGWVAVSATLLDSGRAQAVKGFNENTTSYIWLNQYKPVAQIGYSIFVYYIP